MKRILQFEGAALCMAGISAFHWLGQSWWWFGALILAPDLSFLGYLAGPRIGAICYNALHSTLGAFILAALSFFMWPQLPLLASISAIWFAHIGVDRALGYGLKYSSGFKDTHLGKL